MVNSKLKKYALYSKEFRGLPNGWHNLRAFNFLVGENSTGKSSFLQLIQLIDSREHMMFLEICGAIPGVDTAFDVCSRKSSRKETTIGFMIKESESAGGVDFGRLATYKQENDLMALAKLTVVSDGLAMRLKRSADRILFRVDQFEYDEELKHSQNCDKLELLHFKKDRFKKLIDVDWSEEDSLSVWYNALSQATNSISEKGSGRGFMYPRPPLGCLSHGPIRAKTRRLHHGSRGDFSSTGEHTPYLLRDMLGKAPNLSTAIDDFGRASGLYDKISVTSVKTAINDRPFALEIQKSGSYYYVDELGFGVSQVLPIITDIAFTSKNHAFLVQQPELHLHPRAQAALGDVFLAASEEGQTFVVETHSDFIIDRFRLKHKNSENSPSAQIIFFEKGEDGENVAHEIQLKPDGTMENIPENYRAFFVKEAMEKFENF